MRNLNQRRAKEIVSEAVRKGELIDLKKQIVPCKDCGKRAQHYDHRDYEKPLEVDAVCPGCNVKRGAGKNKRGDIYRYRHRIMRMKPSNDLWDESRRLALMASIGASNVSMTVICREAEVSPRWLAYFISGERMKEVGYLRLKRLHAVLSQHHRSWKKAQQRNRS